MIKAIKIKIPDRNIQTFEGVLKIFLKSTEKLLSQMVYYLFRISKAQ